MTRYLVRRFLLLLPTLFLVSLCTFALLRLIPGDPMLIMLGEHARTDQIARFRAEKGLDRPIWVQYVRYLTGLLRGDWGRSIRTNLPVTRELGERLPATIELSLASMGLACALGIPLGVLAARRRDGLLDWLIGGATLVGVSMPLFWLGLLASYWLGYRSGWFPPSGRLTIGVQIEPIGEAWGLSNGSFASLFRIVSGLLDSSYVLSSVLSCNTEALFDALKHLVLPAVTLSAVPLAVIVRMTRACLLDVLAEDHVRTARAKGLPERVVLVRHAMKNAWPQILTAIGLQLGSLFCGAIMTETVFSWPGVGQLVVDRVLARDYPVVQGVVLAVSLLLALTGIVVDIACAYLNPRIRYG